MPKSAEGVDELRGTRFAQVLSHAHISVLFCTTFKRKKLFILCGQNVCTLFHLIYFNSIVLFIFCYSLVCLTVTCLLL